MGEVWEGHDTSLDRDVAIKFLRFPEGIYDERLVRRFMREARVTARLQHPGVPAVFDVGAHEERPFLVMERINGVSVSGLLAERGALPVGWAAAIAAQVCAVLSVAHEASLVHRDLKPANLMLEPDGTVKVLDFGLAVALDLPEFSQITGSGQLIGTPSYMAPEQVSTAVSTPRSDLYALGCTLYQMLTGHQLFTGSTAYSTMNKQVSQEPPPVSRERPDVPPELEWLLLELLAKKAERRPADAEEVYQRLLPVVTGLGPLPGALASPDAPSPVRMYATVLQRVFDDTTPPPAPPVPTPREEAAATTQRQDMSRADLERARGTASELLADSEYGQAAEVLESAVTAAERAFGVVDPDVVSLRAEWARVLFDGGDYVGAAPAYEALALDVAKRDGPDDELVLWYRLRHATCHALIGDTARALDILHRLLTDEQRIYGADHARPLELRRQIGLLQLGAGQRELAEETLRPLLADLERLRGPDHPSTLGVRELLEGVEKS
ncbi:serine/threonine protein kinase PkaE [Salinactinospora qingdaonensis]|uniref:non-specific serine/threonine protein kinase n=2 Tax=Salinactinospora qingdaonensis TaxID=702744 RepID=A0ABP7FEZ0_9ACTN